MDPWPWVLGTTGTGTLGTCGLGPRALPTLDHEGIILVEQPTNMTENKKQHANINVYNVLRSWDYQKQMCLQVSFLMDGIMVSRCHGIMVQ